MSIRVFLTTSKYGGPLTIPVPAIPYIQKISYSSGTLNFGTSSTAFREDIITPTLISWSSTLVSYVSGTLAFNTSSTAFREDIMNAIAVSWSLTKISYLSSTVQNITSSTAFQVDIQ
jgi:hypothetical protein